MCMKSRDNRLRAIVWVLCCLLTASSRTTEALILHPDKDPDLAQWNDRPHEQVIGSWGRTGSCVVISPDCVIATRHQRGKKETPVQVGPVTYYVTDIWDHKTADLRIARLRGANFRTVAELYTGRSELFEEAVIAGYGVGRERLLVAQNRVYGYRWERRPSMAFRAGTNRIEAVRDSSSHKGLNSDVLVALFDGPDSYRATEFECIPTGRDSGGGWFIKENGQWKLAGISRSVQGHTSYGRPVNRRNNLQESWFRDRESPFDPKPDYFDAVRISSYVDWIRETVPVSTPGDLNGDQQIDRLDLAVFASLWLSSDCAGLHPCLGADFEPDGDVDLDDLAKFAEYLSLDSP